MKRLLVSVAGLFLVAGFSAAQVNTTSAAAADFAWGQNLISNDNGTTSQFWWQGVVQPGRSYCVESGQVAANGQPGLFVNTILTIFGNDATTVITTNDEGNNNEPKVHGFSKACWIATLSDINFIKVTPASATNSSLISLRFVETTMFCPWFFIAGDYNAFSLIRNTSVSTLSGVVVTWYGLNGTQAGTTTVSIPGNGTVILNARDFVNPATFSNGSVVITHTGSPQQLTASTTTLSGTTGLGFDALFVQREQW